MPLPLTPDQNRLILMATTIIENIPRFTPNRNIMDHCVSCAALSSTGRIFTGVNVSHFSGGSCAESVAFGNAAAAGVSSVYSPGTKGADGKKKTLICCLSVANDQRGVISPCGKCGLFVTALQAASTQGHTSIVELLLECKADVQAGGKRDSFWTFDSSQGDNYANNDSHHGYALHAAACRGHIQIVEILCRNNADVEAIDDFYGNALHAAAMGGNVQIVDFLAGHTADINSEGGHYGFALQAAAALAHIEVVKLLIAKGAGLRSLGGHYITALKAAQRCGHSAVSNATRVYIIIDHV